MDMQSRDATAFGRIGWDPRLAQTSDWGTPSDREATLRDLLPTFRNEARINPEGAIRRLLVAVEHEARLAAEVESMRILASLPRVDGADTRRECAICLDTDSGDDASSQEEGQSNEGPRSATGWLKLPCGHVYHEACLGNWFRQSNHRITCPLCRIDVGTAVDSTSSSAEARESQVEPQESGESDVMDNGSTAPVAPTGLTQEDSDQQPTEEQGAMPTPDSTVSAASPSSSVELTGPT